MSLRRGRSSRPMLHPLRHRLMAVVITLLAAGAVVIGVASTLVLRSSLLAQLDEELLAASLRAERGAEVTPQTAPSGLSVPGQGVGTVVLADLGPFVLAGYITADGQVARLDSAQIDRLLTVPDDGRIHTIELGILGDHRAVARTLSDGTAQVTGLSTAGVSATLQRHVATTAGVSLGGLTLVGVVGTALVRRELRQLDRVAATAAAVTATSLDHGEVLLDHRVPAGDTDPSTEVGQVGAALNRLLEHVEAALAARHESETKVRRFVADAGHELRTPLASIRGYAELVRRLPQEVPPDVLHALSRVESEATRMTALVEDLLLLARLDAGRPLERASVDLAGLAADMVSDAQVSGPDHTWVLDLPDDGAATVVGDPHALHQVIGNLLTNARVHTPAGTTVVTTVEGGPTVTVRVRDDGPGIPAELLGRLFDRFARGDAARSPGTGSTGLGLAIADAVVRAHGGGIAVDGTPGATTFTVTLPGAPPPPP